MKKRQVELLAENARDEEEGLYGYRDGMKVVSDDAGYWLEVNGEKQVGNEDLLSLARKIVLEAKS